MRRLRAVIEQHARLVAAEVGFEGATLIVARRGEIEVGHEGEMGMRGAFA